MAGHTQGAGVVRPGGLAGAVAPDGGRVGGALGWRSVAAPLWAGGAFALLDLLLSGLGVHGDGLLFHF